MDNDGDPETARRVAFHHFNVFGNTMTKMLSAFGSYTWRGQEGSGTESGTSIEQPVEEIERRRRSPRFRNSTAATGGGRYFFNTLLDVTVRPVRVRRVRLFG